MVSLKLGRVASTILALVENRLELFALELREEQQRFVVVLVLAACGVGLGLLAVVAATAAVVMCLEPRYQALGWLVAAAVYALACLAAWLMVRWRIQHRPLPFAHTRYEIEKDREWL